MQLRWRCETWKMSFDPLRNHCLITVSLNSVLILVTSHINNKILFPDSNFLPDFLNFGFLILLTPNSCTMPYLQFCRKGCYTDLESGWRDGDKRLG